MSIYHKVNYDSKQRFNSYWYQINEALKLRSRCTLEVGIGNGFVSRYLKQFGLSIITLDVCKDLNPDFIGSVTNMPFKDDQFEACLCYEVLEHLPYEKLPNALLEINRITKNAAILSLPDDSWHVGFSINSLQSPTFSVPRLINRTLVWEGHHYWEIGKSNLTLKMILKMINGSGFVIRKTYRVFENPFHRFFVLTKNGLDDSM